MEEVKKLQLLQPLLIRVFDNLFLKIDSNIISLDVLSLIETGDVLLQVFCVFSLEYPIPVGSAFRLWLFGRLM